jgi:uncharacterized protein with FMN-binding domain
MRAMTKNTTALTLGGLVLVGALASCSAPAATDTGSDTGTTDSGTPADSGTYADGEYSASGTYQAPSGTETVDVTVTLADNVITAVEVEGHATDPEAKLHQGEFKDGIAAAVVGKNIDEIQVDRVGGSSLTSGGFNQAIDAIKADAAA